MTRTADRGPPNGGPSIYTVEQLSPNRSLLPNGSMLCQSVPIARTGWMQYGEGETPVSVNEYGVAHIERTADDLFRDETLGSIIGAAVTDDHPDEDVTPMNWQELAKGFVLKVWRGTDGDSDVILADMLITDADLIASVQAGKREVSLGYDAAYEEITKGVGRQSDIIANHVALVEKGRCGPRCAIGDRSYERKEDMPATAKRVKLRDGMSRIRAIFKDAESALAEMDTDDNLADTPAPGTNVHIHLGGGRTGVKTGTPTEGGDSDLEGEGAGAGGGEQEDPVEKRFQTIEAGLKSVTDAVGQLATSVKDALAQMGGQGSANPNNSTGDEGNTEEEEEVNKNGRTGDSAALATSYQKLASNIEILVPGFRMPTFDSALPRAKTVDAMCSLRRRALDAFAATTVGADVLKTVGAPDDLGALDCKGIASTFNAAASVKALLNNAAATRDSKTTPSQETKAPAMLSLSELNKRNAEYWAARS